MNALAPLAERLRGRVRFHEPLAEHTTYRIGGPAAALVEPVDAEDVAMALAVTAEAGLPWLVIGLGSNLLVRDSGFAGVVLKMGRAVAGLTPVGAGVWRAGAGLPTPLLARRTADAGFAGVHRLVGVPGTVGGGVYMNAGAHAQEFRDVVRRVWLVNASGVAEERVGDAIAWVYRASNLGRVVVLEAEVALAEEDPAVLTRDLREHYRWRKQGTPFQEPCCGSVFRNPVGRADGKTAGRLIDAAGLKGYQIGGAQVSPVHANYIVNTGGARAADVLAVIAHVRTVVRDRFAVELELEVQVVGDE
ncbi:MAG: UDP-N-acetylmuramate dehydrogenase [Gemmatimonadales bacterium]